ncbi:hypothetical protein GCM10009815_39050 [Nocardioides marmoribigeumensis]
MHTLLAMLATATLLVVAAGLPSSAGAAVVRGPDPGSGFGYGFDACDAPSQRAMNAWNQHSHFSAVGIYIAGMNRACSSQPHLDRRWVRTQKARGWKLLPLVVGRQASCAPRGLYRGKRISPRPAGLYRQARGQGADAARGAARAARHLGIREGSVLWFDLEGFDTTRTHCRRSALHFVSGWSRQVRRDGFRSGLYSSASTLRMLGPARAYPDVFSLPGYLWFAHWNGRATVATKYLSNNHWMPHRRVHQFRGGHSERHGGRRLVIDSNYYSVGQGIWIGKEQRRSHCGVRISYGRYETMRPGARGPGVRAAQCVLRDGRHYRGRLTGRYDRRTTRAVRHFQAVHPRLRATGVLTRGTWTALLSRGDRPALKYGSQGTAVRRLQRALNAATRASVAVDGIFGLGDARVVERYQRRHHLPATGVVSARTWRLLQRGNL